MGSPLGPFEGPPPWSGRESLHAIVNAAPIVVFAGDANGAITFEEGRALETIGFKPGQHVGCLVEEVFPSQPGILKAVRRALDGEEFTAVLRVEDQSFECWFSPARSGNRVVGFIGVAANVTERLKLEAQLVEFSDRQKARIAHEIHDVLCQDLVTLAFDLRALEKNLAEARSQDLAKLRRAAEALDRAITVARCLSRGLSPIQVSTDGLTIALNQLAESTRSLHDIQCTLQHNSPVTLREQDAINLYRIAQEAVNNAVRHGKARRIQLSLLHKSDGLELCIADDGIWITASKQNECMGLKIMEFRARALGAQLKIEGSPGGGTTVRCFMNGAPGETSDNPKH